MNNKLISILLTMFLTISLFPSIPASTKALESQEGQLLYQANFNDPIWGFKSKADLRTPDVDVSQDGSAVTITGAAGSGYFWGGEIPNLPLANNSYTVEFSIIRSTDEASGSAGVHAFNDSQNLNGNGALSYGFSTFGSRQMYVARYQIGSREQGPEGYRFVTYPPRDTVIDQDGRATQYFKYEVDGETGVISCYIRSGGIYKFVGATPVLDFGTENLSMILFTFGTDVSVSLNDVKVYDGLLVRGGLTPEANGELLLELSDLTQPATGAQGTIYTPGISHQSSENMATYSYDAHEGATISTLNQSVVGQTLYGHYVANQALYGGYTNLSLNSRSKYTVTYQNKMPVDAGTGLRISTNGSYMSSAGFEDNPEGKGNLLYGQNPNGYSSYVEYSDAMKQNGSIYVDNGYTNVAIEIDGYKITVYINGVNLLSGDVGKPLQRHLESGYTSDVLALAIQDVFADATTPSTVKSAIKNIKVYAGHIMQDSVEEDVWDSGTSDYTINGNPITEYKIVYNSKLVYSKESAINVRDMLLNKTGANLEVVPDTMPESNYEILVGSTSRQASRDVYTEYDRPNVYYTVKPAGDKLLIVSQGKMSGDKAEDAFEAYIMGLSGLAIGNGLNLSGDCKTEAFALSPFDTDLKVLQSNIFFHSPEFVNGYSFQQRAELQADIYLATLPDIITFNEFLNDISYRIVDLIKDYYTIDKAPFENAYDLSALNDPRLGSYHETPIAYRTDKYEVIDSGYRLYDGELVYFHHLTWGLFRELATGHVFLVSNNHYGPQHMPGGKFTFFAEQTINRVNELLVKYGEIPVILSGDWYFWKPNQPYNFVIQNGYLEATDNAQVKHTPGYGTYQTIGSGQTNGVNEDLVFYSPNGLTALTHRVYVNDSSINASDHYPVIVDLKFNTHQIFYDVGVGTGAPASQMKVSGVDLNLSREIPTREGYYFDGWNTDSTGTTRVYTPNQSYTADASITLYAVWKPIVPASVADGYYFITNNTDATNISIADSNNGTQFKTAAKGTISSKEQIFLFQRQSDGSYKVTNSLTGKVMENKDGVNALSNPVAQNDSNDTTAQRWWIVQNGTKYNLINAGSGIFLDISHSSVSPGANLLMWFNSGSVNGLNFALNPAGLSVRYDANGGSGAPIPQMKVSGVDLNLSREIPTREGYYFDGWDIDSAGTTRVYTPNQSYTADASITLYAVWKPIVPASVADGYYFITNNTDATNISIADSNNGTQFKTAAKGTISSKEQIFLFQRQSDGSYKITNSLTGKVMENKDGVNVLANPVAQNESNDTAAQQWWIVQNGTKYNLINAGSGIFLDISHSSVSPGANLLMWFNSGSANGLNFALNPAGLSVRYDANGGTGAPIPQMKVSGVDLNLSREIPTREGYYFDGWDTDSAGTTRVYTPNQSYTADVSITLYAVWKPIVPAAVEDGYYFITNNTDATNISIADSNNGTQFKTAAKGTLSSKEQIFLFQRQSDGTYKITNSLTGKVMENKNDVNVLSNPVAQNDSNDTTAQRWWIVQNGTKYNLINAGSGIFLDISHSSVSLGANLLMWFNSGSANGLNFSLNPAGLSIRYDVGGGMGAPVPQMKVSGVNLNLSKEIPTRKGYYFNGWDTDSAGTTRVYTPNQSYTANSSITLYAVWRPIVPVKILDAYYFITNNTNATNISISDSNNGTQFKTATKGTNRSKEQIFLFQRQSDGSYKITNYLTGKVMENKNGVNVLSNPVAQKDSNDTPAQRWWIVQNGTKYNLINAGSGIFLDISHSSVSPGANLLMWFNSGSANGLNFSLNRVKS
ncbi:RICIN domain-containing protein [Paenibacillus chungangensis]|uniref:RICIN domain-containing protein n=1 Tax=Paenibacillus chungangensis TaxID=696535 RepID=A0ABW3HSQ8_9BACL